MTKDGAVLFGYAFQSEWTKSSGGGEPAALYRLPHSFYFSGWPQDPPNAPILSQNFCNFSIKKPDAAKTWDLVAQSAEGKPIPVCQFNA